MLDWLKEHQQILVWLTAASVVVFVGSLVIVPVIVVRLPPDYFLRSRRAPGMWAGRHALLRIGLRVARNVLGWVLILAGLAMLVLPGQGLLVILIGVLMVEFPGKFRFERWLVSRRGILRSLNWLRGKFGRPPLRVKNGHGANAGEPGAAGSSSPP